MKTLPFTDVLIVGGGWSGLLLAKELGSRTPLSVVVLERGGPRKTEDYADAMDELDYSVRMRMMQDLSQETVTLRHSPNQRALPLRQHGSFLQGSGTGGSGEHWNGTVPRFQPDVFELRSRTIEKYGAARLPEDHAIQDWGITYNELEPYYARADLLIGSCGRAGNLRGQRIDGGNIFEAPPQRRIPESTHQDSPPPPLLRDAGNIPRYHPYPNPAATLGRALHRPGRRRPRRCSISRLLRALRRHDRRQSTAHRHAPSGHPEAQERSTEPALGVRRICPRYFARSRESPRA